jgi:hypothetical protein
MLSFTDAYQNVREYHQSNPKVKESQGIIPARIIIGVTGHRELIDEEIYADRIAEILKEISAIFSPLKETPVVYTVLSPLAEGADRFVAQEILKREQSQLEVVLPFDPDVYAQDFKDSSSREEFHDLLDKARKVVTLAVGQGKKEAYANAGRYVVDNCDFLIALWDGEKSAGRGGTAEIVTYAKASGCPLFWINTSNKDQTVFEEGAGVNFQSFIRFEDFNTEKIGAARVEQESENYRQTLRSLAHEANYSSDLLARIEEKILPRFVRADLLAERYQRYYFRAGSWVYALAALAVAAVTFQILFFPHVLEIAWIEVLCILGVIAIYGIGNRKKWHQKWIDYRFLTERLRSAIFLALTGMNVTAMRPPRHLSLSYSAQDWMVSAFSTVWSELPKPDHSPSLEFTELKAFLVRAWIDVQIDYHRKSSEQHQHRYKILLHTGNFLFGLTLLTAFFHVFHLGPAVLNTLFGFLSIVFPTTGAALGAIRTHREYLRNAKRSGEMVRHLEELKKQAKSAQRKEQFFLLVREIEETMLHENEDWRVVVRFHELEPPA